MKLGILIPEFPSQTHVFFWREIEALERLGVEVKILSTKRPVEACPHPFAAEAARRTHYVFPPRPAALRTAAASLRRLPDVLAYLASLSGNLKDRARHVLYAACALDFVEYATGEQLDHVHVHSCADAAHVAAIARRLGGPTFSLHLHGDLQVYGRDHRQKMRDSLFVAAAARPMQDQVITEAGVPAERAFTLIQGVDTTRFLARKAGPRSGPLHLVTVARLNRVKGHAHALAAIKYMLDKGLDLRYSIVGSGPDRALIEAEIQRHGIGDRVEMPGSLGEHAILELLRAAHVFILPSIGIGEASPVAVMEAMASGLAVICSRIGGTPDMISDGVDGLLVDRGDEAGIATAIERLADDDYRNRIGAAARLRAEQQFDSSVRARILVETIQRWKCV